MGLHRINQPTTANPAADTTLSHSSSETPAKANTRRKRVPINELSHDDAVNQAKESLLNTLSMVAKTKHELREKLLKKGYPEHVADEAIARLEEVGVINDANYAESYAASRHTGRGLSASAIRRELSRKGMDGELIDDAVSDITIDDERTRARELVDKKAPATRGLDHQARIRRLAGMLARRGYNPGLAFEVVKQALTEEGVDTDDLPDLT